MVLRKYGRSLTPNFLEAVLDVAKHGKEDGDVKARCPHD